MPSTVPRHGPTSSRRPGTPYRAAARGIPTRPPGYQWSTAMWIGVTVPNATNMLNLSSTRPDMDPLALAQCIDACRDCAIACTSCADACLFEARVEELRRCIAINVSCADICDATARVLTRVGAHDPDLVGPMLQACARAARICAQECERHAAMHAHCRVCAETCRACERACQSALAGMA
jgi:hypothetical protein